MVAERSSVSGDRGIIADTPLKVVVDILFGKHMLKATEDFVCLGCVDFFGLDYVAGRRVVLFKSGS